MCFVIYICMYSVAVKVAHLNEYDDNKYEIEAEEFGQKNWKQWYNKFKKQNLL